MECLAVYAEVPTFTHKGLASMASVSESTTSKEQRTGSQVVASLANSAANSPHIIKNVHSSSVCKLSTHTLLIG